MTLVHVYRVCLYRLLQCNKIDIPLYSIKVSMLNVVQYDKNDLTSLTLSITSFANHIK